MANDATANENTRALHAALGRYQLEVVRWNRQINLVSRQDTEARAAELISQCRLAWERLVQSGLQGWTAEDVVWYFDLGSGGGLPGFVWHVLLSGRWPDSRTWLVEPREKRAWFLERLNQVTPTHPLSVWSARWGETPPCGGETAPNRLLVSLKALHLKDLEVIKGLATALVGIGPALDAELLIARFYPPDQRLNRRLVADLEILTETTTCGGLVCRPAGHMVLAPQRSTVAGAALMISTYRVTR